MGVNSTSAAHLHVRVMGRTCRWAGKIKKNTHPKHSTAHFRDQGRDTAETPQFDLSRDPAACDAAPCNRWMTVQVRAGRVLTMC